MTDRQVFSPLTLKANGLVCGRGGIELSRELAFALSPGQCMLLRGPNGTGKSTLLLTIAGVVSPLRGSFEIESAGPDDGPQLHYCGHRNATKARMTVLENLAFWRAVNGPSGIGVEEALEHVGLGTLGGLDAGYLSAGQSRRLALARLLVTLRPIWLLDEPTAALDVEGHALVTRLIDGHLDSGGMVLAATHDPITLPDPARMETLVLGARP